MAETSSKKQDIIDLTADSDSTASLDSEDEDLRTAIAISLQDQRIETRDLDAPTSPEKMSTISNTTSTVFGLDRKQMELDRLARLKRKRNEISPPPRRPGENPKAQNRTTPTPTNSSSGEKSSSKDEVKPALHTDIRRTSIPHGSYLSYEDGVVKQTWCLGFPRTSKDIKLEEIIDRSNLEAAVLSSFIWDFDWLLPKFDTKRTKFVFVMHAKEEHRRTEIRNDFSGIPNVRVCFPNMDGIVNCMHSKLMMLFYPNYLRIAVPTANLVPFDWGENGGTMENTVFVIDLPRRLLPAGNPTTGFYNSLVSFIRAQGLPEDVIKRMQAFDFQKTTSFGFVHSVGGMHYGSELKQTGMCGLATTVAALGLKTGQQIQIDYVTSSVGNLNEEFLQSIYLAAQGDDGLTGYQARHGKPLSGPNDGQTSHSSLGRGKGEWRDGFRFYFPSVETVKTSRGGPGTAGTICFNERWWQSAKFPRSNMRDCSSHRKGLLMHNKIMFVRFPRPLSGLDGTKYSGWGYVGSANLSESAWGRIVHDRASKSPKLNCRNWECGVVLPVPLGSNDQADQEAGNSGLHVLCRTIPVPMQYQRTSYNDKTPWFFEA